MPSLSLDVLRCYGFAILSVELAVVVRLAFYPILGDHYPFFLFFVSIVLAAGFGGCGPSLLALAWVSVDYLFLRNRASPYIFASKFQLAFAFFSVGLAITVLGGVWRAARERAIARSVELRRALEAQQADRLRLQITVREREEPFRTLADATPVLIWGSKTDKLCNYFNKQWLDFTGRTSEQEMGNGWSEGVHPDDLERCLETYVTAFDALAPFTMEYRLRRHDGEYRWVLDNGVPRFAPDGTFSGYIGSCLDITDRRRAEDELRNADRCKEEFLAVLSHELRNPLAPIQTAVDLLEQAGASKAGSEQELAVIKRQVQNLKRLVDDLLDVSRISRGKIELRKEVVELAAVVAQAVEAARPLLNDRHQELHVSIAKEPIILEADSTRLDQILFNLLNNAGKYTPHGGRIWLDVEPLQSEVMIRVRDTGIGIDLRASAYQCC
jgi:PAS domain S-box-containing protein